MRWSGNWHTLGRPVRCVEGRLYRHDPQFDDPDLETDVGPCPDCCGYGCDEEGEARLAAHEEEAARGE